MAEIPLATLSRGQAEAFERAAEAGRTERKLKVDERRRNGTIRDADTIIGKASRSALELRETWNALWSDLEEHTLDEGDLQKIGELLRDVYGRWHRVLSGMCQDASELTAAGHSLNSTPMLELAILEVERLQVALEKNWPWMERPWLPVDPKLVQESREAIARGEGQSIEELLRDLQGRIQPTG
jgi:hypothetical protein